MIVSVIPSGYNLLPYHWLCRIYLFYYSPEQSNPRAVIQLSLVRTSHHFLYSCDRHL